MTFFIFILAVLNLVIFNMLYTHFMPILKPKFKALGLRWTYHAQAFFEIHFWQIEDIKRRDIKKRTPVPIVEVPKHQIPDSWSWIVKVRNVENLDFETFEELDTKLLEK